MMFHFSLKQDLYLLSWAKLEPQYYMLFTFLFLNIQTLNWCIKRSLLSFLLQLVLSCTSSSLHKGNLVLRRLKNGRRKANSFGATLSMQTSWTYKSRKRVLESSFHWSSQVVYWRQVIRIVRVPSWQLDPKNAQFWVQLESWWKFWPYLPFLLFFYPFREFFKSNYLIIPIYNKTN